MNKVWEEELFVGFRCGRRDALNGVGGGIGTTKVHCAFYCHHPPLSKTVKCFLFISRDTRAQSRLKTVSMNGLSISCSLCPHACTASTPLPPASSPVPTNENQTSCSLYPHACTASTPLSPSSSPASPGANVPFSTAARCARATYPYTGKYWSRNGSSCRLPGVSLQSRIRSMTMANMPCSMTPEFSIRRFALSASFDENVPLASVLAKTV